MVQICIVFHSQLAFFLWYFAISVITFSVSKFVNKMDTRIFMTVSKMATQAIAMMPPPPPPVYVLSIYLIQFDGDETICQK